MTGQKTVRRRWSSVPIYFLNQKVVYSRSGKSFSAIFSGPYALNEEPYIRIAVGNYPNLLVARRQEDKLLKEHPAPLNMEVYENGGVRKFTKEASKAWKYYAKRTKKVSENMFSPRSHVSWTYTIVRSVI